MKKLFLISALLTCWQIVIGQQVSGTIMDGTLGEPLIGATILEKGTDNGTITDIDGNFTFTATSENPVIEISFLGYATQEVVYDGTSISVSLFEDAATLDEVVVVGYGVQKKKVVTGSITQVSAEELEDKQVQRLEQALQGRTSGVNVIQGSGQPGSGAQIRIRGSGTLGNADPLYVVDGVPIGGGIDYLNADDIESIEVLKDASSAIYGTRAANGVVLVTTKSGSPGMKVNYSAYYGLQRPARKLAVLNATEYAIISNENSVAAGGPILFDDPQSLGVGTDWQDAVFRTDAPMVNHSISLNAGSRKSKYFASFGYFDQDGIVSEDKSNYKRINLRFNSTHELNDRWKIGNTIAYSRVKATGVSVNNEFGSPIGRAVNLDPITPIYETDPENLASSVYTNFPVVRDETGVFGISNYVSSEVVNPLAALEIQQGFGWSDKFVASGFLEFEIIEGLKAKSQIGSDLAFWGGQSFSPVHYLNATNRLDINSYGRSHNRGLVWIWENFLTYEKEIDNHDFSIVLGTSATQNKGEGISGSIRDIPVDNIEDASLGFATTGETQSYGGFEYEEKLSSVFGRLNYNFSERYLLTAILRRDGSSKFGANNKFGYFPSLSVGWNLTDENFMPTNDILKYMKLRASWGITGNDRIADFAFLPTVGTGASYTIGDANDLIIGATPNALANPDLRWEQTTQINLGFDSKLFNYFEFIVDVYQKKTDGILFVSELPRFVGFGSPLGNVGIVNNEGIELELGYDREWNDFSVGFNVNYSYNRNEVEFISDDKTFVPGARFGPQGLEITRASVGLPIAYLFGYKTDGVFQNQTEVDAYVNAEGEPLLPNAAPGDLRFMDIDNDGDVDEDDRTIIGDGNPDHTFGLGVDLKWKNFDFSVFGQGIAGNEITNITRRFDLVGANYSASVLNRWTGEGTSNDYPRLIQTDPNRNFTRSSDFYVEDGAFLRLRNVQIGYNLPESLRNKLNIGETRIYFSMNNVYTFTKYSGFDPEIIGGVDRGQYPNPRTFLFGLNVNLLDVKTEE